MTNEEAINLLDNLIGMIEDNQNSDYDDSLHMAIDALQQPERKRGKWQEKTINDEVLIEEWQSAQCSICGKYHTTPYSYYFDDFNFCPNCGADMRGDNNEIN